MQKKVNLESTSGGALNKFKKNIEKICNYITNPIHLLIVLDNYRIIRLTDKTKIKLTYRRSFKKKLNLDDPKTYNEKLQWLKLYNRNPLYTDLVDKYEMKKYITNIIGEEYIIPTIGIYNKFSEIDFSELPKKFVIKCTHDSGGLVICYDKNTFDIKDARKKINRALKQNYYVKFREWPYKNVKPRIIIEKYMEDNEDLELRDYKFYCFDGYVKAIMVATNRQNKTEELCFDYFDSEYKHLNLTNHWHPNAKIKPHKPKQFEKMLELARKLSKGFPHIRIDFYEVNNHIYIGELTFFDMGGLLKIHPDDWETEWGNLIKLPDKVKK